MTEVDKLPIIYFRSSYWTCTVCKHGNTMNRSKCGKRDCAGVRPLICNDQSFYITPLSAENIKVGKSNRPLVDYQHEYSCPFCCAPNTLQFTYSVRELAILHKHIEHIHPDKKFLINKLF